MGYSFSDRSLNNLYGVHPYLVAMVVMALRGHTKIDFMVLDGLRTKQEQQKLVDRGRSRTMDSLHLEQVDGYAHAVDLAPLVAGSIPWDDWEMFEYVADVMREAAVNLGYNDFLVWGGSWESLKDGPHFQLEGI